MVNTRFGSFPHSTLIDAPWGSQIRASRVDTGSRGRRGQPQENKRKRVQAEAEASAKKQKLEAGDAIEVSEDLSGPGASTPAKDDTEAKEGPTGFIHLLPPTPENWTGSLPHRTQVVYTPDYSYILHRIRARPGSKLIEAGAGSGSFTHASARAVYSGYPSLESESSTKKRRVGKVWSYEFHEQRHEKLAKELKDHGLEGVVEVTHRDVCGEGFLVDGQSPEANAIFLDLPAPWLALPHLARSKPVKASSPEPAIGQSGTPTSDTDEKPFISPLNPKVSTHICTFSPCIEQVQKTVSVMRQLGWVDIEMVEIAAKKIEVRRERVGLEAIEQRGALNIPASVDEAVNRLLEIEGTFKNYHETGETVTSVKRTKQHQNPNSKKAIIASLVEGKVYKDGRLIHRTEQEIKTHTSYLVFAILPMEWSAEDEEKAAAKWPVKARKDDDKGEFIGRSRKQIKKAEAQAKKEALKAAKDGATEVVHTEQ